MHKTVRGVLAAVLTPRLSSGLVDERSMAKNIELLLEAGVDAVVINGATGEYHRTSCADFSQMLDVAGQAAGPKRFIAGIGASDARATLRLGEQAISAGATAVLLPAPHFFEYSSDDIAEYCRFVAEELDGNILLYNLPQFTSGFDLTTVQSLLEECPNIKGIKDSSGSLEILRALTHSGPSNVSRILGSDAVLIQAQEEDLFDAVISGVAGVLPELIVLLGRAGAATESEQYRESALLLEELLTRLHSCPVPWGLKWIAERRGLGMFDMPYPLSKARADQRRAFQEWLDEWLVRAVPVLHMAEALG